MTDRAYTVAELDELRRVVREKVIWGSYSGRGGEGFRVVSHDPKRTEKTVEERVRTHMLAGHTAKDLLDSETPVSAPETTS